MVSQTVIELEDFEVQEFIFRLGDFVRDGEIFPVDCDEEFGNEPATEISVALDLDWLED